MRRISLGVGLFSALTLLSGTAGAQKTARIPSNYGNVNGGEPSS